MVQSLDIETPDPQSQGQRRLPLRFALIAILLIAAVTVWVTNSWLTDRFAESTRARTEVRLALYSGNIISELQRTAVVPLARVIAMPPRLAFDGPFVIFHHQGLLLKYLKIIRFVLVWDHGH